MSIDKDTVKHISKLARISLDEKKVDSLSKDLTSIMRFIENLNTLNTDKTTPLTSIIMHLSNPEKIKSKMEK